MNLNTYKYIYFIGIGGIGMSALARYFGKKNLHVYGYDKVESCLCKKLEQEGINIHYEDAIGNIPDIIIKNKSKSLVVYTPAIPCENKEITYFRSNNFSVMKRSSVLGMITKNHFTIAIAGTHGKTTTSSMLAHILCDAGISCTAFLGGISKNYHSNLIFGKDDGIIVVEADEFDRSFLSLNPDVAVITSIEEDHLDIYNTRATLFRAFADFSERIKTGGKLLLEEKVDSSIFKREDISILKYSTEEQVRCSASNIMSNAGNMIFDVNYNNEKIRNIKLHMGGEYNVSNAVASIFVSKILGLSNENIVSSVNTFLGIERRFDTHFDTDEIVFIDDYAHHPTEVEEIICAVKKMYSGRKITVVFQPHLYTRTKDFFDDFARSLSLSDRLILLNIYSAREKKIKGVSSKLLLDKCVVEDKELSDLSGIVDLLKTKKLDVLLTLGAGDISTVVNPIKDILHEEYI